MFILVKKCWRAHPVMASSEGCQNFKGLQANNSWCMCDAEADAQKRPLCVVLAAQGAVRDTTLRMVLAVLVSKGG